MLLAHDAQLLFLSSLVFLESRVVQHEMYTKEAIFSCTAANDKTFRAGSGKVTTVGL
jgi:hypothetical protein